PQRGLERVDDVAAAPDLRRLLVSPRPADDRFDPGVERAELPEARIEHRVDRGTLDQCGGHGAVDPTGVDRALRRVGGAARFAGSFGGLLDVRVPADRHRCEAHERPVGCSVLVDDQVDHGAVTLEPVEGPGRGAADVEAPAGRRPVAVAPPGGVAAELVGGVEAARVEERLAEAHRHRGVVGPLARPQAEGPATDHVGDRLERPRRRELHRRADGIADGEADQRPHGTVAGGHAHPPAKASMTRGSSDWNTSWPTWSTPWTAWRVTSATVAAARWSASHSRSPTPSWAGPRR